MSLHEQYAHDSELFAFHQNRLPEPGWADELSPGELAYIKAELRQSASLRRRWGFRPSARRLSEGRIRAIARNGFSVKERRVSASITGDETTQAVVWPSPGLRPFPSGYEKSPPKRS